MDKPITQTEIIQAVQKTPLLSPSASRLLQIHSDPDTGVGDVVAIVKCDAALTARILKVVNSAAFNLLQPVSSIDRAVSYLGARMVVGIAIGDSAALLFQKPLEGYEGEGGSLWGHDLFAAIASRAVAGRARSALDADLAFTGGLLHDLGKALLSEFLKGASPGFLEEIDSGEVRDYLAAEEQKLGLTHAQVGYELARTWSLPEAMQQVILHHHQPDAAAEEYRALVYAVHLGDIIAMMGGMGTGSDSLQYRLDPGHRDYFDLAPEDLAAIMLEVQDEFAKIAAAML